MACAEYEEYYEIIRCIPRGRVLTYGDVATIAGRPDRARRVGYALSALRGAAGEDVPWWRVVNARGEISQRGGAEDCAAEQRRLLRQEGVRMDRQGRIALQRYAHRPGSS